LFGNGLTAIAITPNGETAYVCTGLDAVTPIRTDTTTALSRLRPVAQARSRPRLSVGLAQKLRATHGAQPAVGGPLM
jgi:hypothetical protein